MPVRGHVASRSLRRRLKRSVGYAAPFGTSPASSDSTLHLRLASRLRRSPHAARRPRHSARPRVARRPHVGTAGPGSRGVPRAGRHTEAEDEGAVALLQVASLGFYFVIAFVELALLGPP